MVKTKTWDNTLLLTLRGWIPIVLLPVAAFAQTECVDCHALIAAALKKPVVHPGGCLACHIEHQAAGAHGSPPYL